MKRALSNKVFAVCLLVILIGIAILGSSGTAYAYIYADTDGVAGDEKIWSDVSCVYVEHPKTGVTQPHCLYTLFNIYGTSNVDGNPGQEIIGTWQGTNGQGLFVIRDNETAPRLYYFNNMQFSIYGISETNGQPGNDIIVHYCQGCTGHFPPDAKGDCASTNAGTPVTIYVLGNDSSIMSQNALVPSSLNVASSPSHGSTQVSNGTIIYTPAAGFVGIDYFKYVVSDNGGVVSNEATVSVHVGAESGSCAYPATNSESLAGPNNLSALNPYAGTGTIAMSGIRIIHDNNYNSSQYSYDGAIYAINNVRNTDGINGNEIIVTWQGNSQNAIDVIHDSTGSRKTYYPYVPYFIHSISDYDSVPGEEICYSYLFGSTWYGLITDRLQSNDLTGSSCSTFAHTVPTAPSNLTATAISASQVNLTWSDNSSNETQFKIERKVGSTGSYAQIAAVAANSTSYSDAGRASNTTYCYRVSAYNANGNSYSNEACATTQSIPLPASPSYLTATAFSSSQVSLTWSDNSSNETGFKIERKLGSTGAYAQITQVAANSTSYSDGGLASNTTYYYRVRASNAGGDSAYSNEAPAKTQEAIPAAPSNLTATAISFSQVNLAWNDNSANEVGFSIERKVGSTGIYIPLPVVSANVINYADTGLTSNTTYYYRVRSYNAVGYSTYSNEVSILTPVIPPSGLTATKVSATQINLTWTMDSAAAETGFVVERKTGTSGTYVPIALVGANVTSYASMGLLQGTSYFYRVRAYYYGFGDSANSNIANDITSIPPTPTISQVVAGYNHSLVLKSNGTLWAWGNNGYGQLGDGTTGDKSLPVQIGAGSTWVSVAAGTSHTLALKSDGTLWAWGYNNSGQLGDGTTLSKSSPVRIGADNTWVSVAAGFYHTVALKSDGTLWAWGYNGSGQLGDGTNYDRSAPV